MNYYNQQYLTEKSKEVIVCIIGSKEKIYLIKMKIQIC